MLLFMIGGEFIFLQIMSYLGILFFFIKKITLQGYIEVHWDKIIQKFDKTGKEPSFTVRLKTLLTHNLPFKGKLDYIK